jgi:hypothetical protein
LRTPSGDGYENAAGELDRLGGQRHVQGRALADIPGVNEQVKGRKAQTLTDSARAYRRVNDLGHVDTANGAAGLV